MKVDMKQEFNNNSIMIFLLESILFVIIYSTFSSVFDIIVGYRNETILVVKRILEFILNMLYIFILHVSTHTDFKYNHTLNISKTILSVVFVFSIIIFYESSIDVILSKYVTLGEDAASESGMFEYAVPLFIQTCITAPIAEELIVRGFLLKLISRKYSVNKGIIFSSLFFSMLHFDFLNTIFYVAVGVSLALVYIKTNSIVNCIFIHGMINFLAIMSYYRNIDITFNGVNIVLTIISVIIAIVSYKLMNKV